jgi:hypothetical protein
MPNQKEKSVDLLIRNKVVDLAIASKALDRIGKDLEIPSKALMQLQVALVCQSGSSFTNFFEANAQRLVDTIK